VGNTFGEKKMYLLPRETFNDVSFSLKTVKEFYVSPFVDLQSSFDFSLQIPNKKLALKVDGYIGSERFLITTLTGKQKEMSNLNLFWYAIRFPFITLKVISLIHWQALILYLKKVPHFKKNENMHLQKEVYNLKSF